MNNKKIKRQNKIFKNATMNAVFFYTKHFMLFDSTSKQKKITILL